MNHKIKPRWVWHFLWQTPEKIQSKEFVSKSKKMYTKLDNLILEIASMIESGTIKVGALGLSQDSANFVREYNSSRSDLAEPIETEREITKLTALYYKIVSLDHHKDRDCIWSINKIWYYGDEPKYRVEHYGYIFKDVEEEFDSYEKAEKFLSKMVKEAISEQKGWAKEVLKTPRDWDKTDNKVAKKIIKLLK